MLPAAYAAIAIFLAGNLYRVLRVARMPFHLRWDLYPMPKDAARHVAQPPSAMQQLGSPPDLSEERGYSSAQNSMGRHGFSHAETPAQLWTALAAEASDLFPRSIDDDDAARAPEHTNTQAQEFAYIAREILAFDTVRRRNRRLWFWSWMMHLGLFGLIVTGILGLLSAPLATVRLTALFAGLIGIAGAAGLFLHRALGSLHASTSRRDLFNLVFLAALFGTAAATGAQEHGSAQVLAFAAALRTANPASLGAIAKAHLLIACAFLAYFPFTHMTHAYMKFFSFHRVRWDDTPLSLDAAGQRAMAQNLLRPIAWSASHIAGSGATWAAAVQAVEDKR